MEQSSHLISLWPFTLDIGVTKAKESAKDWSRLASIHSNNANNLSSNWSQDTPTSL
jgi:hypothetical protein